MAKWFDPKSFIIGILATLLCFFTLGANSPGFNSGEIAKLRQLAARVQSNGDLDMGSNRIIMLGSTIYDNGSLGGGLVISGGANRVHVYGSLLIDGDLQPRKGVLRPGANIDMGTNKIIMLGSTIFDDGSEGGGLQLRGGANRIQHFGHVIQR